MSTVVNHIDSIYLWYDVKTWHLTSADVLLKMHSLSIIRRKISDKFQKMNIYKKLQQSSSKLTSGSSISKEMLEISIPKRSLSSFAKQIHCGILNAILEQNKDIGCTFETDTSLFINNTSIKKEKEKRHWFITEKIWMNCGFN